MRRVIFCTVMVAGLLFATRGISAWNTFSFTVVPFDFDPYRTHLVQAEWEGGIGCPTNAWTTPDGTTFVGFTDPACPSGDPRDRRNFGLLLVKTGPTGNFASAGATIRGVRGINLTELGYDLRKSGAFFDPLGSHCGGGAPRFNVVTSDDVNHFVACASPPPLQIPSTSTGWIRLRWTTVELLAAFPPILPTDTVKSLEIVFDEGQDTGPDFFGAAILDNIDVNGVLVGRGVEAPEERDRDECEGEDKDHRHFHAHSSASRPESSNMSFMDPSDGTKVQMVGGARSVSYSGACVTVVGDALMNGNPDHVVTFAACDLSALSTPLLPKIGTYSVLVTGASGVVYQKSGALTSGFVNIHPH